MRKYAQTPMQTVLEVENLKIIGSQRIYLDFGPGEPAEHHAFNVFCVVRRIAARERESKEGRDRPYR